MAVAPAAHAGPPSLSWKAPTNGSTVQGVLRGSTCEAIAKDDYGVRNVGFFVDGKPANTEFYAPYNCTIDTRTLTNGGHVFKARATDTVNHVVERSIKVTVANGTSTGTATPTTLNWPTNDTTRLPLGSELFSDGFDAGRLSKWYVQALPCRASVVSSPVAAGTGAARFEVRQGELEPATGDARAELTAPLHFYAGEERWFRVAVNFAQWDPAQTVKMSSGVRPGV
jgi:hypothetical protein